MQRLVFMGTFWKSVTIPKGVDPVWVEADFLFYATSWAAAHAAGFSEKRSEQLAEALVSKRLYPGLVYDSVLERDLAKVYMA